MKLLIAADMEGITGVVSWDHVALEHPEYARFRSLMTADVNAAIRGAFNAGVDEVVVSDGHGDKTNLLIEELDGRARLNTGSGPLAMVQGIDAGVDAVFFVGYHARAGTPHAILSHTVSSRSVAGVWINGREVGEIGINAAVCGHYRAPLLFVSGDQAACAEAQVEVPGVQVAMTKQACGHRAAEVLPPEVTWPLIEQTAAQAVRFYCQGRGPVPVQVETPVSLRVQLQTPDMADRAARLLTVARLDGKTVEFHAETMPRAYQVFRLVVRLAGAG